MGFGASIVLIAAGAILRWGVTDTVGVLGELGRLRWDLNPPHGSLE